MLLTHLPFIVSVIKRIPSSARSGNSSEHTVRGASPGSSDFEKSRLTFLTKPLLTVRIFCRAQIRFICFKLLHYPQKDPKRNIRLPPPVRIFWTAIRILACDWCSRKSLPPLAVRGVFTNGTVSPFVTFWHR